MSNERERERELWVSKFIEDRKEGHEVNYSETCLKRPPHGARTSGRCRQVFSKARFPRNRQIFEALLNSYERCGTHAFDLRNGSSRQSGASGGLMRYSRTCPCDHLTKATTWKLRTHNFSPFNSRIQMYGVRSWKCDHLRNANCGHRRSAQSVDSTCKKRPLASNCSEKHFLIA